VSDYLSTVPTAIAIMNGFIALVVANFYKEHRTAKIVLVVVTAIFSAAAIGATIYSQYSMLAAKAAEAARKNAIHEQLGIFIAAGDDLMGKSRDINQNAPETEVTQWAEKVENYLSENLGPSYVFRFRDESGVQGHPPEGIAGKRLFLWAITYLRVFRLEQFSQEV
jgi:hypothetical protein